MGKAILIILLSSVVLYSIITLNTNKKLEQVTADTVDHHSEIRARNIANSMIQIALSDLSDNHNYRVNAPATRDLLGGTVTYTVKDKDFDGKSLIQLYSEAEYFGSTRRVIAYTKANATFGPSFFDYSVLAGGDFIMNGQDNRIIDDGNPFWNASTHSNGETIFNGANFAMEGFATYSDGITADWGDVTINPNQNPDGDPVHSTAPEIPVPNFSAASYKNDADDVYEGDKTFSGNITMGTADNPKIIYVGGNLNIQGTVSGYGIFVVKNDIEITGDLVPDTPDPNGSKLAL